MAAGTSDPELADHLAGSYYFTAGLLGQTGDPIGALENYRRAASIREAALKVDPKNMSLNAHLAADYAGMAQSMQRRGDLIHAIQLQAKAVETLEQNSRAYPNNATLREYAAEATNRLGTFRQDHGETSAALEAFRHAHEIFLELLAADPKNHLEKSNFGFSDNGIGRSLIALGKPASAMKVYREAVATFEALSPASGNRYTRTGLAGSLSGLGDAYSALAAEPHTSAKVARDRRHEACAWYEKSRAIWADKDKRHELESDERADSRLVMQAIAKCEEQFGGTKPEHSR